jgi:hypothetical protein
MLLRLPSADSPGVHWHSSRRLAQPPRSATAVHGGRAQAHQGKPDAVAPGFAPPGLEEGEAVPSRYDPNRTVNRLSTGALFEFKQVTYAVKVPQSHTLHCTLSDPSAVTCTFPRSTIAGLTPSHVR